MKKKDFIKEIRKADITKQDWADELVALLPRCYERGYLDSMLSNWNISEMPMDETLKEEIEEWCEYFRWNL